MAATSIQVWYDNVLEAIQLLSTLDASGDRRPVQFTLGDLNVAYSTSDLPQLRALLQEIAGMLSKRNIRKRTLAQYGAGNSTLPVS